MCSGVHERMEKSGVSLHMSGHGKTPASVCFLWRRGINAEDPGELMGVPLVYC